MKTLLFFLMVTLMLTSCAIKPMYGDRYSNRQALRDVQRSSEKRDRVFNDYMRKH